MTSLNISKNAPDIFWQKFFAKFSDIDILPTKEWKDVHIIAYFCKKYKTQYNIDYTFKFNASPSKCYENYNLKKVVSMLSSDPEILKQYIDWVFEEKVIQRKKRITVIGFLASVDMIAEFKFKYLTNNFAMDRAYPLPDNIKEIVIRSGFTAETYGDLAFLRSMFQDSNLVALWERLESENFDLSVLAKIK